MVDLFHYYCFLLFWFSFCVFTFVSTCLVKTPYSQMMKMKRKFSLIVHSLCTLTCISFHFNWLELNQIKCCTHKRFICDHYGSWSIHFYLHQTLPPAHIFYFSSCTLHLLMSLLPPPPTAPGPKAHVNTYHSLPSLKLLFWPQPIKKLLPPHSTGPDCKHSTRNFSKMEKQEST
jgi:hypothetical protein